MRIIKYSPYVFYVLLLTVLCLDTRRLPPRACSNWAAGMDGYWTRFLTSATGDDRGLFGGQLESTDSVKSQRSVNRIFSAAGGIAESREIRPATSL